MSLNVGKKLSIAFYWHFHQPPYQLSEESDYLMPWVRLHAVKDYLDMLLIMKDFPRLKLNFNFVPTLLDALIEYGEKNYHDIHSRLTVTPIEELSAEDKEFILNNFFDANYNSMICPNEPYDRLYQKRCKPEGLSINDFSKQEFSDIMAWFNLAWIDPVFKEIFPEFSSLLEKGENYSLEDRINIIELHRKIIKMIIPTYRQYLEQGKIEITTSPYYHPILPILLDVKSAQKNLSTPDINLTDLGMAEDAKNQTKMALDRVEQIFGKRPQGVWPPEHSMSPEELEMFKDLGINWTISDEGILSNSINFEFIRDFKGYLEDPYFLMKSYQYKTQSSNIKIVFRDSVIPNLISFEYSNHDSKLAASDLYDRIKVIQNKLKSSPDEHHLLTIAMDGENCWENYPQDGIIFLKKIYSLLEKDDSIETVLLSDYLEAEKQHKKLEKICTGSWINKNFQLWLAEPVKNIAWQFLKQTKDDFEKLKKVNPENPNIEQAYKELMIAQGSDWFWWFGEPNDSGQDHVFDYMFREHLKNVYKFFDAEYPERLDDPFLAIDSEPVRYPKCFFTPLLDGVEHVNDQWENAGCINMPDGPSRQENKLFDKICYGADKNNFYFRLYLNEFFQETFLDSMFLSQLYLYMKNGDRKQLLSPMRLVNQTENIFPIMKEKFHNEIRISIINNKLYSIRLIKSMLGGVWVAKHSKDMKVAFEKVFDVSVPFDDIDIKSGEKLEFFIANANFGIKDTFVPQDHLLTIQRP